VGANYSQRDGGERSRKLGHTEKQQDPSVIAVVEKIRL
jgi:hypothetical protein